MLNRSLPKFYFFNCVYKSMNSHKHIYSSSITIFYLTHFSSLYPNTFYFKPFDQWLKFKVKFASSSKLLPPNRFPPRLFENHPKLRCFSSRIQVKRSISPKHVRVTIKQTKNSLGQSSSEWKAMQRIQRNFCKIAWLPCNAYVCRFRVRWSGHDFAVVTFIKDLDESAGIRAFESSSFTTS